MNPRIDPPCDMGENPHRLVRLLTLLIVGYVPLIGIGVYYLLGTHAMIASIASGSIALASFFVTKKIIHNLLFNKNKFFYILISFFKFILIVLAVWLAVYKFDFDLPGMLVGFSVIPIATVTLLFFPNTLHS